MSAPYKPNPDQPMDKQQRTVQAANYVKDNAGVMQDNAAKIIQGVAQGNLPSNAQIEQAIDQGERFLEKTEQQGNLDAKTIEFVETTKAVMEDVKQILEEKNKDEELQEFAKASAGLAKDVAQADTTRIKQRAKQAHAQFADEELSEAQQILRDGRIVAAKLIRSNEFRGIIVQLLEIIRAMLGQTGDWNELRNRIDANISKAQEKLDENLANIPATDEEQRAKAEEIKGQAKETADKAAHAVASAAEKTQQQAKTKDTTSETDKKSIEELQKAYDSMSLSQRQQHQRPEFPPEGYEQLAQQKTQEAADKAGQKVQEAQSKIAAAVPEDQRRALQQQVRAFLNKIANTPDWKKPINSLMNLARLVRYDIQETARPVAEEAKGMVTQSANYDKMMRSGRQILEEFSGGKSLDSLFDTYRQLSIKMRQDERLSQYLHEWQVTLEQAMNTPHMINKPDWQKQRVDRLLDKAEGLFDDYRPLLEQFVWEVRDLLERIQNDPQLVKLRQDTAHLVNIVVRDENGNFTLNNEIVNKARTIVLPMIMDQLRYIPIPRIEDRVSGPLGQYDIVLDNICFSAYDVMPEHLRMKLYNDLDLNLKQLTTEKAKTHAKLKLTHIMTHMRDIKLHYRKVAFPYISDSPSIDIDIKGHEGLKVTLLLSVAQTQPIFRIKDVEAKIDKMSIHAHDSGLSWLYNMVTSLFKARIKHTIERRIEETIREVGQNITDQLNAAVDVIPSAAEIRQVAREQISALSSQMGAKKEQVKEEEKQAREQIADKTSEFQQQQEKQQQQEQQQQQQQLAKASEV